MRTLIAVGIVITMLLAPAGLTACSSTIEEYRAMAIEELETYAASRGQSNFTEANWSLVQNHAAYGIAAIEAAQTKSAIHTARDAAKAAIRAVEREEVTLEDFELAIMVDEDTLTYEQLYYRSFWVYVELKNNTGRDLEIIVSRLFWPSISNWMPDSIDMPIAETITFPNNSIIRREPVLQSGEMSLSARFELGATGYGEESERLPRGTHDLRFAATFYIVGEQGSENQRVTITSNTIELTVK